ncbi:MAG: GRP family sugar transporter, partial [Limosilactobacillus fermentum]|nr:GRP family sugar transporter [Limosilactobacillus fermentum]
MEYLIALIPALGWGLMPLITGKMGGSEANQIFGIGAGASIVGIIAFLITQPTVSA